MLSKRPVLTIIAAVFFLFKLFSSHILCVTKIRFCCTEFPIISIFSGNYVLNYLYNETKQPSFVEEELSLLYARITKLSWFDSSKDEWFFRNILQDISKFVQVK